MTDLSDALARLDTVDELAIGDHVAVYEAVLEAMRQELDGGSEA